MKKRSIVVKYSENIADKFQDYLTDEAAIIKNGFADKIFFPVNQKEVIEIVLEASSTKTPITISGGGTGLSGGRVPLGGWIIATDDIIRIEHPEHEVWSDPETKIEYGLNLHSIDETNALLTVPVSMTIQSIQNYVRAKGWFFPPDPTERTAFIGGAVNTNASGARTFHFGPTREWTQGLKVVLMDGTSLELNRSQNDGTITEDSILINYDDSIIRVPRPKYELPKTRKNVAGPVIRDNSNIIDLFIGTGGLFGITTEITLKLIKEPKEIVSIFVFCKTMDQVYSIIEECQKNRRSNKFPDALAVEFLDKRAIEIMRTADETISRENEALMILEQHAENSDELEDAIMYWSEFFDNLGIEDTRVALTYSEIVVFKKLRHMVPETINSIVKQYGQSKIGSDYAVPEEYLIEYFELAFEIGNKFEQYLDLQSPLDGKPGYALWAHAGDTHLHLNLIPRTDQETVIGKEMVIELIKKTVELGGSIAAEHGLGKKTFGGKPALYYQLGEEGIEEIIKMKLSLDPFNLLNRGNLTG
ncbi:MAG: FAD-binding oxidoreductase [Candidatus Heimdallarchaeota archaeon]|nr:FAD-binding oxidoreductase [Candidatus Heimdallarchaeota archaeon]